MVAVEVAIPDGCGPGAAFMVTHDGQELEVTVPDGCGPGDLLTVEMPGGAPATARSVEHELYGDKGASGCNGARCYWGCYRALCCKPSLEQRTLHVLSMKAPTEANTISNLQLARQLDDMEVPEEFQQRDRLAYIFNAENWRGQKDGIAYCFMTQRDYRFWGLWQRTTGMLFALIITLCSALVPVLIGVQGSLPPKGTQAEKDKMDTLIK